MTTRHPTLLYCLTALIAVLVFIAAGTITVAALGAATTTRVSVAPDGSDGDNNSAGAEISADGRFVAFHSRAGNLVSNDTDTCSHSFDANCLDVFVKDRQTGEMTNVSVATDGTEGNKGSFGPSLSADGRYVAFFSEATTLVSGDTNEEHDVFVHDRDTRETTRVSVASDGSQADGGPTFNGYEHPVISGDGRYVAFNSIATNLVTSDTNEAVDVFLHDRETAQTIRVSVASDGTEANGAAYSPSISHDGRYIAYMSYATNLVSDDTNTFCGDAGNENCPDVFVYDRVTRETTRVSVASDGMEADGHSTRPLISGDGQLVVFTSSAGNLSGREFPTTFDAFIHNRATGETEVVTHIVASDEGAQGATVTDISPDGRFVVFHTERRMAEEDTSGCSFSSPPYCADVYLRDLQAAYNDFTRVSVATDGTQGDELSIEGTVSGDGRYVAFESLATTLVGDDTNNVCGGTEDENCRDVFLRDRGEEVPTAVTGSGVSANPDGSRFGMLAAGGLIALGVAGLWVRRRYTR
ncbi:MAG TPA: hypothetical protein VF707_17075 [Ardenticatenaceae bacterium]